MAGGEFLWDQSNMTKSASLFLCNGKPLKSFKRKLRDMLYIFFFLENYSACRWHKNGWQQGLVAQTCSIVSVGKKWTHSRCALGVAPRDLLTDKM